MQRCRRHTARTAGTPRRAPRSGLLLGLFLLSASACADQHSECLARELARGHEPAGSELICTLRKVFQSRIRYKPETEPVEMTVGSPPMISDDTDTPGAGNWEVNLAFNGEASSTRRAFEAPLLDFNFGIGQRLQLKYEVPYLMLHDALQAAATDGASGVGDSIAGIKYRYYDNAESGLSLALYPQIRFHTPAARRAVSEAGSTFLLPLLLTREYESASLTANLGLERNDVEQRTDYFASVGVGKRLGASLAAMVEIAGQDLREAADRRFIVNFGLRRKLDSRQAVLVSIGRELRAADGAARSTHFSLSYQRLFGE